MTDSRIARLTAAAGIAFVALAVLEQIIAGLLPAPPDPGASIVDIVAFGANHATQGLFIAWYSGLGIAFLVVFGVGLLHVLDPRGGPISRIGFAGVILAYAIALVRFGLLVAFVQTARPGDDSGPAALFVAVDALARMYVFPLALFLGAVAILAHQVSIAAWVAWGAGALAIANIAISLGAVFGPDLGFAGFLAFLIWIAVTSVALRSRSLGRAVGPAATGTPKEALS